MTVFPARLAMTLLISIASSHDAAAQVLDKQRSLRPAFWDNRGLGLVCRSDSVLCMSGRGHHNDGDMRILG